MLTIFDFVLLAIIFCFVIYGLTKGFIRSVGSLIGLVISIYLAGKWYYLLAGHLQSILGNFKNLSYILSFFIIFILVDLIVNLLFYLLDKIFDFLAFIPFLKSINHLAGALIGFLEGAFILAIIIYLLTKYPLWPFLNNALSVSKVVPYLLKLVNLLLPFLPLALKQLKSIIPI